jgi:hypothetical protein
MIRGKCLCVTPLATGFLLMKKDHKPEGSGSEEGLSNVVRKNPENRE